MRDDPFFENTSRKSLDMQGQPIEFPVLYYDLRYISAIFVVRTKRLNNILPDAFFKPLEILPGVGMVGITAFEYRDTSVGPYNEVSIAVPIKFPPGFIIPGITAFSMMRKNYFPVYIWQLPVTTDTAMKGGVQFYNFPKFLADITFIDRDQTVDVILEENNSLILRMSAKKLPTNRTSKLQFHMYSIKDDRILHSLAQGWAPKLGSVIMGNVATLELGDHQIGRELSKLRIGSVARSGQYADGMMSKLYDPDRAWLKQALTSIDI